MPTLLRLAKAIYRATPSARLRRLYFDLFLRLRRGQREIVTREGLTFECDLGEVIDVSLYLEEYERETAAAIDVLCRPGWIAIDVGANVGAHTLRLARCVGPTGRVYAFEPMSYAFSKLQRNLSLNAFPQVEALRIALSNRDEARGTIQARSSWRVGGNPAPEAESVPFARLDTWCASRHVERVDVVKIDVDGHEFEVLSGARETLARNLPVVLIEAGAWHFEAAERNPFSLLASMGYRFWDMRSREPFRDVAGLGDAIRSDAGSEIGSRNVLAACRELPRW